MKTPSTKPLLQTACLAAAAFLFAASLPAAETAAPSEANLLRNTRLVNGLPSGWVLLNRLVPVFSAGDDFVARTDKTTIGPSGYPSFLVDMRHREGVTGPYGKEHDLYFFSELFQVPADGEYTASVFVRGQGSGTLEIIGDKQTKKAGEKFSLTEQDGWKRLSCRFKGSATERLYALRLRLNGTFHFDGFQVNPGSQPTDYASQFPAEVALSPADGDAAAVRTQFDDEASRVAWTVTGASSGDILKGKVIDLDNRSADLPNVTLKGESLETGDWDYALSGLNPRGQFRIEAWVENAEGIRRSSFNELVMTRLRRPHYWGQDAPASPFGTHAEPTSAQILAAKAAGFNWVRLHDAGIQALGWFYVEPEPGVWRFDDGKIDRYRNQNLLILGELGTAPHFRSHAKNATAKPRPVESTKTTAFFAPLEPAEYGDYVKRAVEHFRGKIAHYDIWNEPWHPSFFPVDYVTTAPQTLDRASDVGTGGEGWYLNSASSPENYARLQNEAFAKVKEIDPSIQVVGMNTHTHKGKEGRFSGDVWSQRMAEANGLKTLDVVGYHQYNLTGKIGPQDDALGKEIKWTFAPLGGVEAIKKSGQSVWMTEGSPLARKTFSGFYRHSLPYRDEEDYRANSDRLARYMVRLLSEGMDRMFLYSMDACAGFGEGPRARLFVNEDGFPHPTAAAASNVTWHLENTKYIRSFRLKGQPGTAYVFESPDSTVAVLIPDPAASLPIPKTAGASVKMEDLFGNPPEGDQTETLLFLRGSRGEMAAILKNLET
jgi:hypothetical protein